MLHLTQTNCNIQYNHRKAKSNQQTTVRSVCVCVCVCIALCTTVAHNTHNFPSRQSLLLWRCVFEGRGNMTCGKTYKDYSQRFPWTIWLSLKNGQRRTKSSS